ncbi:NADH:flavin oxidoreductase [Aminithiophilus ramosus]|uniref:NADH:flavin oxidoreductase n=1 Tax=Aminithiophilus ramosus TaxID=3029084 RepID=A0A9Q7EUJ8_9BACT|nr:NADH:flavin oxidoreductase [Aminithiophilus ramosus]QTX31748.1 NADH:flavin oxidoreductase [Aminithiophilus ramosus]
MEGKVSRLFQPLSTGGLSLRNRFMRSATWLAGADEASGALTEGLIGRYGEIAAGGIGLVTTGFAYVRADGRGAPRQWGLHEDARTADVRRLADVVHDGGARLMVQLVHAGAMGLPLDGAGPLLSPSGGVLREGTGPGRAMTDEDIAAVVADFAAASRRGREGGADAVQIHGAHGYLLTQFLSPLHNGRDDGWGQSFEGRSRLFFDVYRAVRAELGDFPVWYKLSLSEGVDGGYGPEEGLRLALALFEAGVDGIEVSGGTGYSPADRAVSRIGITKGASEAYFASEAKTLRAQAPAGRAVALVGGLRSLERMADLVEEGTCDLLSLCRPLIAEPDLINRWVEEDEAPSACVSCNACFRTARRGILHCPVMRDRHEGDWDPLPES